MTKKVNLFLVGAPKCGTTALFEYLSFHPDIGASRIKEPNYFNTDLAGNKKVNSLEAYKKLFTNSENRKVLMEGTTWYLFSNLAAKNIYDYNPKAKIIVMLRNPVVMLQSLHSHYMYHGNIETIRDFKKALDAEIGRKEGKNLPRNSTRPYGVFYSSIIDYAPQINRYFDLFGKENVKVVIFEEFIKNIDKYYDNILDFLNLDRIPYPEFKKINENKIVKNRFIHSFILWFKHKDFFRYLTKKLKLGFGVIKWIRESNREVIKREKIDKDLFTELLNRFEPQIKNTEEILKKDLSIWRSH